MALINYLLAALAIGLQKSFTKDIALGVFVMTQSKGILSGDMMGFTMI
jgi:hypothetical protein